MRWTICLPGRFKWIARKPSMPHGHNPIHVVCGGGNKTVTSGAVDQKGFNPPSIALLNVHEGNETGFS